MLEICIVNFPYGIVPMNSALLLADRHVYTFTDRTDTPVDEFTRRHTVKYIRSTTKIKNIFNL